jgi:hypothetical protein
MTGVLPGLVVLALRSRVLWLIFVCTGFCQTAAAARELPSTVQDLQYGEVLYHYYQQDYFTSIIRLLTAREQSRLPHHADEAELLLGGLDLSYGLRDEAEAIFTRLLDADSTREKVRNRARPCVAGSGEDRWTRARGDLGGRGESAQPGIALDRTQR